MKKVKLWMLCLIGFSLPAFAYTTPNGQPILYCPHHVTCADDGKLDSCKVSDNQYGTWGEPYNIGRISKGVYVLQKVSSSYQVPEYWDGTPQSGHQSAICSYSLIDNQKIEKKITVQPNHAPFPNVQEWSSILFEALITNNTQWSVSGWDAECLSDNPLVCPLVETPEITLITNPAVRVFYWNGEEMHTRISYNKLLNLCGATSECKINISEINSQHKLNGVVTVNITQPDNVQIVGIETAPSSSCLLKKIEPFNTIYCEPIKK